MIEEKEEKDDFSFASFYRETDFHSDQLYQESETLEVECHTIHNIEEILALGIDTNNVKEIIEDINKIVTEASFISHDELFEYKFDVSNIIYALLSVEDTDLEAYADTIALFNRLLEIIEITEKSIGLLINIINQYDKYLSINEIIGLSMKLVEIEYPIPMHILKNIYEHCLPVEDDDIFCDMIYILGWYIQDNANHSDDFINIKIIYSRCIIIIKKVLEKPNVSSICTDSANIEAILDFLIVVVKIIEQNFITLLRLICHMVGDYPGLISLTIKKKSLEVLNNVCATQKRDVLIWVRGHSKFLDHFIDIPSEETCDLLCPIMTMLNMYNKYSYKALTHKLVDAITENCDIKQYPKLQMFVNLFSE